MSADGAAVGNRECVIVLHGLGRTPLAMAALARHLRAAGYSVRNVGYPSQHYPIEQLVEQYLRPVVDEVMAEGVGKLHFVGHSMGGILSRYLLARYRPPMLGRVVTIASPHQGTELVDFLSRTPLFRWLKGPAGVQLGTGSNSVPRQLPAPDYELGSIAGTRSNNAFFSWLMPGVDDGKVPVARTRVEGMTDFITLPFTHTFIQQRRRTCQQVEHFLRHGHFDHAAEAGTDERSGAGGAMA